MMELSISNRDNLIKKLWGLFIDSMVKANIFATYFTHKEKNIPLIQAIQQFSHLESEGVKIHLPRRVEIPFEYSSRYNAEYSKGINQLDMTGDVISKSDLILSSSICDAYKIAIEFNGNRYSIEDELNQQITSLEDGVNLGSPEYQDGRAFRASIDLYIQTLREILQMIEDAEKQ